MMRFIVITFILSMPLYAEFRSWANSEGVKIEAEFVNVQQDHVTLRLRSGKMSTFPVAKLSADDQAFLKTQQSTANPEQKPNGLVAPDRRAKWLTKMDKAQEESKATGLPILVLFTGISWCPYCIKLENEVFDKKEFKTFADQNLVLLMLDFASDGSPANRKDAEFKAEYGVSGYPTYFLVNSAGTKLARSGYSDGINPALFIKWVQDSSVSQAKRP